MDKDVIYTHSGILLSHKKMHWWEQGCPGPSWWGHCQMLPHCCPHCWALWHWGRALTAPLCEPPCTDIRTYVQTARSLATWVRDGKWKEDRLLHGWVLTSRESTIGLIYRVHYGVCLSPALQPGEWLLRRARGLQHLTLLSRQPGLHSPRARGCIRIWPPTIHWSRHCYHPFYGWGNWAPEC